MSGSVVHRDAPGFVAKEPGLVPVKQVLAAPQRGLWAKMGSFSRTVWWVLLSPLRVFLAMRRSMTGASVSLLLIGIVSMNIIWGYPWGGIFSACGALMFIGWGLNQLMSPRIRFDYSLPISSPVDQPFTVVTHACNTSWLPGMELQFAFAETPRRGRKKRFRKKRRKAERLRSA